VGRRVVLAMFGLGAAGTLFGAPLSRGIANSISSGSSGGGLAALVPGGGSFRFYTVTSGFPMEPAGYRLKVGGLVHKELTLSLADLKAMPRTELVKPFQCVTGWRVPGVSWAGIRLSDLLDSAGVANGAKALRFKSFDGIYTESLTLQQGRLPDVLVAYEMYHAPVTREHGGPVRLYVAPMYGYKSIKWLSEISVVDKVEPGYWENFGYDIDAWVGRSNGRSDAPIS
jgi:DMSO/TMAO reductase YedYZ molybdopterin-dependent catalytic subunit